MNLFEIKNLNMTFQDKQVLEDVNLAIKENSFTVISGPSGSGKSTLLKLLGQLISPSSGDILYRQENIDTLEPTSYRKKVSYCFQSPVLFGETVYDNLVFPYDIRELAFDENHALSLLKKVGLDGFLHKKVNEMSGGEKQRVALVRNVLFMPEVLLLDEVTSSLDKENTEMIWEFIRDLYQNEHVAIISVTHQENEIAMATDLIQVDQGKAAYIRES